MTNIPLNLIFEPKGWLMILCIVLVVFDLVMKGFALYKAGKRQQIARFVCIFIFNTCGILPLIYLIINHCKKDSN